MGQMKGERNDLEFLTHHVEKWIQYTLKATVLIFLIGLWHQQ